jgi:hypothetical protein
MTGLDEIPTTAVAPADARPSAIVARLRSYRPSRRAVLRGLVVGAAAATLVPLDWYLARRSVAAAPEDTDDRSEHVECKPAEYNEVSNNWWSGGAAICYGGWRRGTYPCESGYHREGSHAAKGESYVSTRLTSSCSGRNAWRWKGYRCSDAITTVTFGDGTEYNGTTIAACTLRSGLGSSLDVEPPWRRRGDDGRSGAREPHRESPDPSRPRRDDGLLSGLGLGRDPGHGTLLGR